MSQSCRAEQGSGGLRGLDIVRWSVRKAFRETCEMMMARKKPETDSRAVLVQAAAKLFVSNGYDATSVSTILENAGLSKGTFYHYFESKEDLLDSVVESFCKAGLAAVRASTEEPGLGATERLDRFFQVSRSWRVDHLGLMRELISVLHRDENAILRLKISRRNEALAQPLVAEILSQGVAEGVFDVEDPQTMAMLLLRTWTGISELQAELLLSINEDPRQAELLGPRIDLYLRAFERMLGMKEGRLTRPDAELVAAIVKGMAAP